MTKQKVSKRLFEPEVVTVVGNMEVTKEQKRRIAQFKKNQAKLVEEQQQEEK